MELIFLLSYVMVAAVLVVPNFVDIPIHFVMVATAFFAIIAGAHKSMIQTAEAERTGERKVRTPSSLRLPTPDHVMRRSTARCTRRHAL
jgi:hypothetical protein